MKVMMNFYYKFMGKDVHEIVDIINADIEKTMKNGLSAYKLEQQVDLSMGTFELSNAEKLNRYTENLLN